MEAATAESMLLTVMTAISAGVGITLAARRLNVSSIALLLLGGAVLGADGLGVVRTEELGTGLQVIVSLAVGIILFEGGLTLDPTGYRRVSRMVQRLLTVGVLVTWGVTAGVIWLVFHFEPGFCLLAASLVIVTGPTVVGPLLRRIHVCPSVRSILHWEGVLIDPIGVFIAVLCYEWIGEYGHHLAVARFLLRIGWGLLMGAGAGAAMYRLIRHGIVPAERVNTFTLGAATLVFGGAEAVFPESGLLAVTVAGFVVGASRPAELEQIRRFKEEISDLLIGTLFVLLAARLSLDQFFAFGWAGAIVVLSVMLLARPLSVLVSRAGLALPWREQIFLSWVAPRGIVAASMASLFSLRLAEQGMADAAFIETFTYSVIVTTVLLQGFTADPLARVLGLREPPRSGWIIVGSHALGRAVARFIAQAAGETVVLVDLDRQAVSRARAEGLQALRGDAQLMELDADGSLQKAGNLLAMTGNEHLNALLCRRWGEILGPSHVWGWVSREAAPLVVGTPLWPGLPEPTLLSAEIERGEATMERAIGALAGGGDAARCLLAADQEHVEVDPPPGRPCSARERLLLCRQAEYLAASMDEGLVISVERGSLEEVLGQLAARVATLRPGLDADALVRDLLEREQVFPTTLGHGVAAPHAYSDDLDARLCAFARVREGLDMGAVDGEAVRLLFVLVSPSRDPEGHLETLAEIARLTAEARTRERLLRAAVPGGVLEVVASQGR